MMRPARVIKVSVEAGLAIGVCCSLVVAHGCAVYSDASLGGRSGSTEGAGGAGSASGGAGATAPDISKSGSSFVGNGGAATVTPPIRGEGGATDATGGSGDPGSSLLSVMIETPRTVYDLSTLGKTDWIHWGPRDLDVPVRKRGGTGELRDFLPIGSGSYHLFDDDGPTFSWSDGSPTSSGETRNGVFTADEMSGMALSVPAAAAPRRLIVFFSVFAGDALLEVSLSDASAPAFEMEFTASPGSSRWLAATIEYWSPLERQSLAFRWTLLRGEGGSLADHCNVTLVAAVLQ